jgi:hypothetical protein
MWPTCKYLITSTLLVTDQNDRADGTKKYSWAITCYIPTQMALRKIRQMKCSIVPLSVGNVYVKCVGAAIILRVSEVFAKALVNTLDLHDLG